LIEQLKTKEADDAIRTLGAIGPVAADAVPAIVRHLQLHGIDRFDQELEALRHIGAGASKAVPFLDEVAETADKQARSEILRTLIRITGDDKKYLGKLQDMALNADDEWCSYYAFSEIGSLACDHKSAVAFLCRALRSKDQRIRARAVEHVSGVEALADMLEVLATPVSADGFSLRDHSWVLRYLESLGPKARSAVPALKLYIGGDNDPDNVETAKEILDRLEKR
jgi:hypothetical protein